MVVVVVVMVVLAALVSVANGKRVSRCWTWKKPIACHSKHDRDIQNTTDNNRSRWTRRDLQVQNVSQFGIRSRKTTALPLFFFFVHSWLKSFKQINQPNDECAPSWQSSGAREGGEISLVITVLDEEIDAEKRWKLLFWLGDWFSDCPHRIRRRKNKEGGNGCKNECRVGQEYGESYRNFR